MRSEGDTEKVDSPAFTGRPEHSMVEASVRGWRRPALAGAGKVMTHPELLSLGRKQLILLLLF